MSQNLAHRNVNVENHGEPVDNDSLARDVEKRRGEKAYVTGASQHVLEFEKNKVDAVKRLVKHRVNLLKFEMVIDFGKHEKEAHEGPHQRKHLKFGKMLRGFFSLEFKAHFSRNVLTLFDSSVMIKAYLICVDFAWASVFFCFYYFAGL